MKKKYLPKYYPTRNEDLTDEELSHILNSIHKYENRQELLRMILFTVPLIVVILYFLVR